MCTFTLESHLHGGVQFISLIYQPDEYYSSVVATSSVLRRYV